ncbi:hypothetical protein CGRA01v4_05008 [Colletotrichum graminicola]|nr:hypothetical protein CGRA01v4_05008 [Colletotrichum graminicola]
MMVSLVLGPCPVLPSPALSYPGTSKVCALSLEPSIHQPLPSKSGIAVDPELATDADADATWTDGRTTSSDAFEPRRSLLDDLSLLWALDRKQPASRPPADQANRVTPKYKSRS